MKFKAFRPLMAATFVVLVRPTWVFYIAVLAAALTAYTHESANALVLSVNVGPSTSLSIGNCTASSGLGSASLTCGDGSGSLLAVGNVSPGDISAEVDAQASLGAFSGATVTAEYGDVFTIHATDPTSPPSTIPVSLNVVVDGFLSATPPFAVSGFNFIATVGGITATYSVFLDSSGGSVVETCSGTGGFQNGSCPANLHTATLTTDTFNVSTDSAVAVQFLLEMNARASDSSALAEFLHSFRLPIGSDVFNLPDGYTADAPDSFVSNNRFLPPTAATPLPAALPLFASGLGALGLLGWHRKRKARLAA